MDAEKPTQKDRKLEKKEILVSEAREMMGSMLEAMEEDRKNNKRPDSSAGFSKISLEAFAKATNVAVSVEKFKNSGGIANIISAIRCHRSSSATVDFGCRTLAALTLYEKTVVEELMAVAGIEVLVIALEAQADGGTEDACVSLLKCVRSLTQTAENRKSIWKSGGIEAIVLSMTKNMESARVLSHGALVLSNLAFGSIEIKEAVGNLGGLSAIAESMKRHRDSQAVQARGSLAVRNLCFQSEDNQHIAGECGAAAVLVAAIEKYMDDREVVHQSCVALMNISNVSEANRVRIVEAQGGATLVKLMQTYADSATVHEDCISIIRNVAVGSSGAQLEIGLHGGVACVCKAMEKFPKNDKMADKACTALRYLCFLPENRIKVQECRGIEAIIGALKVNIENVSLVENALLALGNATFESEGNKTVVGKCGGILAIINAVEQHRMKEHIQEHGCRVLRNLADGFEFNRRLEAESGAIKTGVFAMIGFPESPSVQEQACAMLLNIALSVTNLEKLADADVERLAEKALNSHSKHRGVQLQAGSLLDRMHGYDVGGVSGSTAAQSSSVNNVPRKGLRGLLGHGSYRQSVGRPGLFSSLRGNQE